MTLPILSIALARRLFLDRHALAEPPTGPAKGADLSGLIDRLGLLQLDSINTVERAHHMILLARRQAYRPKHLKLLHDRDRLLFEHFTHDASLLPITHFPHWKHRFRADTERLRERYTRWQGPDFVQKFEAVLTQIADHGPATSGDVGEDEARSGGGWWDWHPSKVALEYLWRAGRISVLRRDGFTKVYDLTERVIPAEMREAETSPEETTDWAARAALDRLGFATSGEIAAFFKAITPEVSKSWCAAALKRGEIIEIGLVTADGATRKCFARPDVIAQAEATPEPPKRIRVLSPFDPALRDRNRAERLFGFHYRIEVFVPEAKRQYGYYVFPLLEGDRLIGRIDMKADRAAGALRVRKLWLEVGVKPARGRIARLDAELDRMARFSGCERVEYSAGWL